MFNLEHFCVSEIGNVEVISSDVIGQLKEDQVTMGKDFSPELQQKANRLSKQIIV